MIDDGASVDRHHFVPRSRGGKTSEYCHRICHDMIHRLWTEKELELEYSDPEAIRSDPRMQKFIQWVRKKEPGFYVRSKDSRERKRKRRR